MSQDTRPYSSIRVSEELFKPVLEIESGLLNGQSAMIEIGRSEVPIFLLESDMKYKYTTRRVIECYNTWFSA